MCVFPVPDAYLRRTPTGAYIRTVAVRRHRKVPKEVGLVSDLAARRILRVSAVL